jgi:hypothetical protein
MSVSCDVSLHHRFLRAIWRSQHKISNFKSAPVPPHRILINVFKTYHHTTSISEVENNLWIQYSTPFSLNSNVWLSRDYTVVLCTNELVQISGESNTLYPSHQLIHLLSHPILQQYNNEQILINSVRHPHIKNECLLLCYKSRVCFPPSWVSHQPDDMKHNYNKCGLIIRKLHFWMSCFCPASLFRIRQERSKIAWWILAQRYECRRFGNNSLYQIRLTRKDIKGLASSGSQGLPLNVYGCMAG